MYFRVFSLCVHSVENKTTTGHTESVHDHCCNKPPRLGLVANVLDSDVESSSLSVARIRSAQPQGPHPDIDLGGLALLSLINGIKHKNCRVNLQIQSMAKVNHLLEFPHLNWRSSCCLVSSIQISNLSSLSNPGGTWLRTGRLFLGTNYRGARVIGWLVYRL